MIGWIGSSTVLDNETIDFVKVYHGVIAPLISVGKFVSISCVGVGGDHWIYYSVGVGGDHWICYNVGVGGRVEVREFLIGDDF